MSLKDLIDMFKESYFLNDIKLGTEADKINIEVEKTSIQLKYITSGENFKLESASEDDMASIHFANLIKFTFFTSAEYLPLDSMVDIFTWGEDILKELTSYCVSCGNPLDIASDTFITCGDEDCLYESESMPMDNYVTEIAKDNSEGCVFHLQTAMWAITSTRRNTIFEPFPRYFLKEQRKIKRGELSAMTGADYNHLKDFAKIEVLIKKYDINKLVDILKSYSDDKSLLKHLGKDMYNLVRFILMSSKIKVVQSDVLDIKPNGFRQYKLIHDMFKEKEFKDMTKEKFCYLYHGSGMENWFSIIRNGIKIASGSKIMTTGAAYGTGIYASNNFSTSLGYARGSMAMLGVFEVKGERKTYQKSGSIYVIPDDKILILRYILMVPHGQAHSVAAKADQKFNNLTEEVKYVPTSNANRSSRRIIKDLEKLKKEKTAKRLGFTVETEGDNLYKWNVMIHQFEGADAKPLLKDFMNKGIAGVKLEISFPTQYPIHPPFVRIVHPRFQYRTGHITVGGSICMELLTNQGWSPAYSFEALMTDIKALFIEGGARIDPKNWNTPYSFKEAQDAFKRVAAQHNWS